MRFKLKDIKDQEVKEFKFSGIVLELLHLKDTNSLE